MPLKPDGRIAPSQDEFDAWCEHPVTKFVAEAYRIMAKQQRDVWDICFDVPTDKDLSKIRIEYKAREDCYRAFLETTCERYVAIVESTRPGSTVRLTQPIQRRRAAR